MLIKSTKKINTAYAEAKELKQQIKSLEVLLNAKLELIKEYMGGSSIMINNVGAEIVTYKESKPRIVLNTEVLKANYEEVYVACCEEKPGNRVLLLK